MVWEHVYGLIKSMGGVKEIQTLQRWEPKLYNKIETSLSCYFVKSSSIKDKGEVLAVAQTGMHSHSNSDRARRALDPNSH